MKLDAMGARIEIMRSILDQLESDIDFVEAELERKRLRIAELDAEIARRQMAENLEINKKIEKAIGESQR